ncbi:MAG: nuclease [Candidatus Electrothrix sp. AR3]|nr:nuclease [Candidatus Electrothrix sp. AR3]
MGLSLLFNALMEVWYIIPILLLLLFFKTPFFKGWIGEFIINTISKIYLNKSEYHLLKNITLPTDSGTTQIDHIIVSQFGIFVVETKNMKGWILGGKSQKIWTQQIYKHKSKFQNPLHQNYKHTKTIENNLNIDSSKIFSVIVFVGDSTFKTSMPENVTYPIGYIKFIKSKSEVILTNQEVTEIITKIESGKLQSSLNTHRQHVKHVKSIISDKENSTARVCPKCGNQMILRTAKKGKNTGNNFWGCSNFPKCRAVQNAT